MVCLSTPYLFNFFKGCLRLCFEKSPKYASEISRSSRPELSCKKSVLKISQNSQENTCARFSFLIKSQASALQLYLKRDSGTGVLL